MGCAIAFFFEFKTRSPTATSRLVRLDVSRARCSAACALQAPGPGSFDQNTRKFHLQGAKVSPPLSSPFTALRSASEREETVRLCGIFLDLIMSGRPFRTEGIATLTLLRDESRSVGRKIISRGLQSADSRARGSETACEDVAVSRFLTFHYRDEVLTSLIFKTTIFKFTKELFRPTRG